MVYKSFDSNALIFDSAFAEELRDPFFKDLIYCEQVVIEK
jgi:hypothetical protein|tara:strand:+ start:7351 stop:7470 length:120 start_codon:yes stop_codon:yes gene_type:complete